MQFSKGLRGIVTLLLALPCAAVVALETEPVRVGTAHEALFALDMDGTRGLAVGTNATVFESTDAGAEWSRHSVPGTSLALLGVDQRGNHAVAVGQMGAIAVRGADGWQSVPSPTEERLMAVGVNAEGLAVAAGAFGALLRSTDGGLTWDMVSIEWPALDSDQMGIEPHLYDVRVTDAGVVLVVGEYGVVLRSNNGGEDWSVVHRGDASMFAIEIWDDGRGYAVGQNGVILHTRDLGVTWERQETNTKTNLFAVQSWTDGTVVVAGMREWLTSSDDGGHWASHREGDIGTYWYTDVASAGDAGTMLAVGQAGQVVRVATE